MPDGRPYAGPVVSGREVSKSMIAFAVALTGVLVLAAISWIPPLVGKDSGVHVTRPGLLTVTEEADGEVLFADGASVTLHGSGFRLEDAGGVLVDSVTRGSPVSAFTGAVSGRGGQRHEDLGTVASNVAIERRLSTENMARYSGYVYNDDQTVRRALTIDVVESAGRFRFIVDVDAASAVVIHLRHDADTRGYEPSVPDRNLRGRAWWLRNVWPASAPVFTTFRGVSVAIAPADVPRALDLRELGRNDVHIWSGRAELGITRIAPPMQDSGP